MTKPSGNRVKQLPIALMKKITSFSSSKYMTSARQPPKPIPSTESASFEARIIGRPNWPQLSHEYCTALQYEPDFSSNAA